MRILGIETSCDETAAAVVDDGARIASSVVASQEHLHSKYGGVVPEIACRAHVEAITPIIDEALERAGTALGQLDAIAVTTCPGLIGSLLIGLAAAKTLSWLLGLPLAAVNHIYAHLYAPALDEPLPYPVCGLIASGGHTILLRADSPIAVEVLGTTTDDAAGEAFDKAAAVLGLGYPGGPLIDQAARTGDPTAIRFPRTLLEPHSLDFSFSGIKTAVLYHCMGQNARGRHDVPPPPPEAVPDIAASFQEAVVDVLVTKSLRAVDRCGARTLVVGGGVACNSRLRAKLAEAADAEGIALRFAPPALCTDNAAMVAGLAEHLLAAGRVAGPDVTAVSHLPFSRAPRTAKKKAKT
ncbi:MAG: tRNA (adenosine(37)-N6)-threonylcarbamoyltransferase complex transferase subunit TsaD [Candidatus Brocadiae bacterium]|nr:tRNA (adenosine(37)-N6)-threonylcarbamoyltransferase complex transferase subunit TsaD [Candidatus Brocadiia bacterium]